jgi:IQ calmodulin-binding motif
MLRGAFKFKWFLRKFRNRIEKRARDFEALINRSAVKIQKCFRGFVVRKKYGKELANRRIDRNYKHFADIKMHLMIGAQIRIAFLWRMNRIKI